MKKYSLLLFVWLCLGMGAGKGQYTILHNFNDTAGGFPWGCSFTQSRNTLYGMTTYGPWGCIFSIGINGNNYNDFFTFNESYGVPNGSLILSGKKFYGGGEGEMGPPNIFSMDTNGSNYKILSTFGGASGLILSGKKLFGVSYGSGAYGLGYIFSIDTNGNNFKVIYNFNDTNGAKPICPLILSGNKLYGTASAGGADYGVIFSIDTNGSQFKDLFIFNDTNGCGFDLYSSLILAGSRLYGVSEFGGINSTGVIFSIDTDGSGFKDIFNFGDRVTGSRPQCSLTLAGSKLYGTTAYGGEGVGVIFSLDTNGTGFRRLFHFNDTDGAYPTGQLTSIGGSLYGMTGEGGSYGAGVIFKIDTNSVDNDSSLSINVVKPRSSSINIYPNPNPGIFTIAFSHPELVSGSQTIVEIYNVLGEKVLTETLRSTQGDNLINLTGQPNGVYLYRVIKEDGSVVGSGKVVVEKS